MVHIRQHIYKIYGHINENIHVSIWHRKLKNHNFTILANNCAGGIVYNRCGERFLSPTVNLWVGDVSGDFLTFCENLPDYMNAELQFFTDNIKKYPRAWLGGAK